MFWALLPMIAKMFAASGAASGAAGAAGSAGAAGGAAGGAASGAAGGAAAGGAGGAGGGFGSILKMIGGSGGGGGGGGGGLAGMMGGGGGAPAGPGGGSDPASQIMKGPGSEAQDAGSQTYAPVDQSAGALASAQPHGSKFSETVPGQSTDHTSVLESIKKYMEGSKGYAHGGSYLGQAVGENSEPLYVRGQGDGTSDSIPSYLSDGEYVLTAGDVSRIGQGSNEAGARRLDEMRKAIANDAGAKQHQPRIKHPIQYLKEASK